MPPAAVAELERRARRNRLEPGGASFNPDRPRRVCASSPSGAVPPPSATAQAGLPALLRRLLELRAIGSDEAAMLARQGILTLADLQAALDDERIRNDGRRHARGAAAFGRRRARARRAGRSRSAAPGIPPPRASTTSSASAPTVDLLTPAGEVRRYEPLVSSIVIVGRVVRPAGRHRSARPERVDTCSTGAAGGRS